MINANLEVFGPGVDSFLISNMPLGIVLNTSKEPELILLTDEIGKGNNSVESASDWTDFVGRSAWRVSDIRLESIYRIPGEHRRLMDFLFGRTAFGEQFVNFSPHPNYLDSDHYLRVWLQHRWLPIIDFSFLKFEIEDPAQVYPTIFHVIHEMYHAKEQNDFPGISGEREFDLEEAAHRAKSLSEDIRGYFHLTQETAKMVMTGQKEKVPDLVKKIAGCVNNLKGAPELWDVVKFYEYGEGFAEFAAINLFIESNLTDFDGANHIMLDSNQPFFFSTGAYGALTAKSIGIKPDWIIGTNIQNKSIWEFILDHYSDSSQEIGSCSFEGSSGFSLETTTSWLNMMN